tara:strand:- start:330 stop:1418 length:1089 start_codon:yes stop_codon:yes gene_type:complete
MSAMKCQKCNASVMNVIVMVGGLMAFLFIIFVILFMKAKETKEKDNKNVKKGCCGGIQEQRPERKREPSNKRKRPKKNVPEKKTKEELIEDKKGQIAASRMIGDQILIEKMTTTDTNTDVGSTNDAYRGDGQIVIDRIKVFYGWLQIFTALTLTFDIPWPIQLRSFSLGLGFINLDIGFVSDFSCSMAIPFLHKMAVHAGLPVALLLTILLARIPAYILHKQYRKHQKALCVKLMSSLALILYPGLCTRLFASLNIVTVKGLKSSIPPIHSGNVLAVDYSVEAFGSEHYPFVILCIVCMVVFVIGIPFAVLMALRSNRKYLYSAGNTEEHRQKHEDAVDEFGTLYLQCKSYILICFDFNFVF